MDSGPGATRGRLLDAAMSLFAERGFVATTVGDIEAQAGLASRSGALYKYFSSKDELLAAGFERHLATMRDIEGHLALKPLGAIGPELMILGRWLLDELEIERSITHLLEREGDRLGDLRDRMRIEISDRGYRIGAELIARWRTDLSRNTRERMAVVVVGAVINYKRSSWTLGRPPLEVTQDEFLDEWVTTCVALIDGESR